LTTAIGDNAAEFRAATSSATLTVSAVVTPPTGPTLSELTTGLAPAANMDEPAGVVLDGTGIAYVVDSFRNAIRRVGTDGAVVTIAGQSSVNPGSSDGTGAAASFNRPRGIALGSDGALYVTDTLNHTIRRITTAGVVTTFAGTAGSSGTTDGTGSAARFGFPSGIVGDGSGALYVSDQENNTIRKVTLAGVTTTIAGNGSITAADGVGTSAGLPRPGGLALSGNSLYVTAFGEASTNGGNLGELRRMDFSDGSVHTVAGIGSQASAPVETQVDGDATHAVFQFGFYQTGGNDTVNRAAVAVTAGGTVYVTDPGNGSLRTVTAGVTTTLVFGRVPEPNGDGNTIPGAAFGDATEELALAVDPLGFLVVTDASDCDVRRIAQSGATSVAAGLHDRCGALNGKGSGALFGTPGGVAAAPDGTLYVADTNNSAIRRIAVDGTVTTFAGPMGSPGSNDGTATTARFYQPSGIVMDAAGILYVADSTGTTIRRIALDGGVTTLAGSATNFGYAEGAGASVRFSGIKGLAIDTAGVMYAADSGNLAIRKITSAGVVSILTGGPTSTGTVTTVAGAASDNFTRVGSNPRLGSPSGIAILGPKSIAVAASRVYGPGVYGSVYVLTLP
jgi:sugar lactone lactonase YvrE